MIHMTIQQLSSYLDAQLAPDSMERVGIHLSSCGECTSKFAAIERQADRLSSALGHDPGDHLSDKFERMVDERIQNGKRMAAPRPAAVRTLPPLPEAPPDAGPPLSTASGPAREESGPPSAGDSVKRTAEAVASSVRSITGPKRREEDRPRRWHAAWAAVILVVIVTGAGVVASRTGLLPSWNGFPPLEQPSTPTGNAAEEPAAAAAAPPTLSPAQWAVTPGAPPSGSPESPSQEPALTEPAPAPPASRTDLGNSSDLPAGEDALDSPAEEEEDATAPQAGAATTTLRGDELLPSGSAPAVQPPGDTPAPARESAASPAPSRPLTPAEVARHMSERAATDPSASSYEAAARAWDAALGSLHGDAYQDGRWRIAEARYRAWQMDAEDGLRASRATAAIRAYLIAAPPGDEREQARAWLTVIRDSGFRYIESSQ